MHYSRYNKEDELKEAQRMINELKKYCYDNKIPLFVSLCYKNTDEKSLYYNELVASKSNGIILKDDKFRDFVNVVNGFITIPKRNEFSLDEDAIQELFMDEEW